MINNEMNFEIYVNGTRAMVAGTNKFHALNRAKKQNPGARVSLNAPAYRAARHLVRIDTCSRGNGRTFSVAVYSDGTTADLD